MPNWCSNTLTIVGPKKEISRFMKHVKTKETKFNFNTIIQQPVFPEGNEGWYDWRCDNWGTKWNLGEDLSVDQQSDECVVYGFDTAWSPPNENFMSAMAALFPKLTFELEFSECGVGFQGKAVCTEGHLESYTTEDYVDPEDDSGDLIADEETVGSDDPHEAGKN